MIDFVKNVDVFQRRYNCTLSLGDIPNQRFKKFEEENGNDQIYSVLIHQQILLFKCLFSFYDSIFRI